ncbi:MAG: hypothetical protein K9W42_05500 [Candidatus Heimdallarchaeota archaeon]|nr:hypothetical protein [Candidatus Heimdallarchaeota archaeon]
MTKGENSSDLNFSSAPGAFEEKKIVKKTRDFLNIICFIINIIVLIFSLPVIILFIALLPLYIILALIFYGPFWVISKYFFWGSKYKISDIRLEMANPLEASFYFIFNMFFDTPPIFHILLLLAQLIFGAPISLIYMIYKVGKEKAVTPIIGKTLYKKKETMKGVKSIEFLEKLSNRSKSEYEEIISFTQEINQVKEQISVYSLSSTFRSFSKNICDIFRLVKYLKFKRLSLEELQNVHFILSIIKDNSYNLRERIPLFLIYEKKRRKELNKRKFSLEGKDYKRRFFISTWIQKIKLRRKFKKKINAKIENSEEFSKELRKYLGEMRDFQIIANKYLKKVSGII